MIEPSGHEMSTTPIICVSCGFKNTEPLSDGRCASCGAHVSFEADVLLGEGESGLRQGGFDIAWFGIAIFVMAVLTGAIVLGLPRIVPVLDFEGSVGMLVAIPVWFVGGLLVGLISPGRTFLEPVLAVLLVAIPTALSLYSGQTVRTMPAFMYVLFSAVGMLFTLVGAYTGERIQTGAPPASK
jgi:hypothetical protein